MPQVARELSERRRAQKRLEKCEKLAAENNDQNAVAEAGDLAERLATWPEPSLPRLVVDDCTPEQLQMLLASNGGRLASLSSEGGIFDLMAGKYAWNGAADFHVYLQTHAGDLLRCDRISRLAVRCDKLALTCGYAVQPQVLASIVGHSSIFIVPVRVSRAADTMNRELQRSELGATQRGRESFSGNDQA